MEIFGVHILLVLVLAIVSMIIGSLWYSPMLFGNIWMKLVGFTKKDIERSKKQGMGKVFLFAFFAVFVLVLVMSKLFIMIDVESSHEGLLYGLLFWIGFISTTFLNSVLWEGKPIALYLINSSQYLVIFAVLGWFIPMFI